MITGEEIRTLRKKAGFKSQNALAERVGVSRSAVKDWESGKYFPEGENLKKLALALGVSADYLIGIQDLTANNNVIDRLHSNPNTQEGKQKIKDILMMPDKERRELTRKYHEITEAMIPIKLVSPIACAGDGNGYEYMDWKVKGEQYIEKKALIGHLWQCSDMKLIDIEGDSMEPRFYNGDRILFAEGEPISSGDIVIVWWDNRLYIRGYTESKDHVTLKPLNKKYPEISIDNEDTRLFIVGKVIAKVPPIEIVHGMW